MKDSSIKSVAKKSPSTNKKSPASGTNTLKNQKLALERSLEEVSQLQAESEALQEKVARAYEQNEQLLDQALDSIITVDADRKIIFFNKSAERMFGYTRQEILGRSSDELLPNGPISNYKSRDSELPVAEQGQYEEVTRQDGSTFWASFSCCEIEVDGKRQYTVFVKDSTEEKYNREVAEQLRAAVDTGFAAIEFLPDGTILSANRNFCQTMGYAEDDILGQHHRLFCEKEYAQSEEYQNFWRALGEGRVSTGEFERITKDGQRIWLNAAYTPVRDAYGNVVKVTKIALNITGMIESRVQGENLQSAVDTGWAYIEFDPSGVISSVNKNFLSVLGYAEEKEVVGQHHRIFCENEYAQSAEYVIFWDNLRAGRIQSGEFRRRTRTGEEVWINASYTPVKDGQGKVVKVIKIASDITKMIHSRKQGENLKSAVNTSFAAIEFSPDGTILTANANFCQTMQYANQDEFVGKHHRLFCEPQYAESAEYKNFWVNLAAGKVNAGEFERITKNGQRVWLSASYTPVTNAEGNVEKVIKIATDITSVKTPVLQVRDIISKMAQGDLTLRFDAKSDGYVQEMGEALNVAIENLNALLSNIGKNASLVADSSSSVLEKSESVKDNTSEVASAITQMAKGAQDQAIKTDDSSKLVEDVRASSSDMEEKANSIYRTAERGQQSCENGIKIIKNLINNMGGINDSASVTSESISILTQRAEEIGRTLNVITDIAAQTNLLALNAAIEAARAGDAGRGFAVVAEEIRKLAEDSRRSAVDIEKIIGDVQKDTQSASKAIETMSSSVKDGSLATQEASSIFEEIALASSNTLSFSKEIQQATSAQKLSIDTVAKNIEQIVVVAEETAAGSEEVASSSQQLNNSMQEITEASNVLSEIAEELQRGINQFKLQKTQQ